MADEYRDSVGNVIGDHSRVVIRTTGEMGKVAAIDRYKDTSVQVILSPGDGNAVRGAKVRWCRPDRLLVIPESPEPRPQTWGVALSDKLQSGDWVS